MVSLFLMNLLSRASVDSKHKSEDSGLHLLFLAPRDLWRLDSKINLTVGSLEFARIWDLEICNGFRKVVGFFKFRPALGR